MKTRAVAASGRQAGSCAKGAILAALACWIGATAVAQEPAPAAVNPRDQKVTSDIIDAANLFSADAVAAGRTELHRIEGETRLATVIETIDSLKGARLVDEATRRAQRSGIRGIFILIPKQERSIELLVSRRDWSRLPPPRQEAIRAAFIEAFLRRNFDLGLKQGIAAIATAAAAHGPLEQPAAQPNPFLPDFVPGAPVATTAPAGTAGALVVRSQVRLALAGARAIIAGAEAKAQSMQLKVNIAVVDDGGHLLAFERMDGARPASGYTAITKATAAATFRAPTGPIPAGTTNPDPILNLSVQNAAAASGGKITSLLGGVPVTVDGQIIGGVGVGGGTGEQDARIARAGLDALAAQLAKPPVLEKEPASPAPAR
jgi:glc operon protein GlcG